MCSNTAGTTSHDTSNNNNNEETNKEQETQPQPPQDNEVEDSSKSSPPPPSFWQKLVAFYWTNEFLILVVCAILLARAYPPLGADYLQPDITATWLAVCFIFLMAGLGLKTAEFTKAFQQLYFNVVVQVFNFGVVSASVYGLSRALQAASILSDDLADGMVVCASLPMTINMVLVLTKAADGNEAAAIFNAAAGNLLGVFLSPILIVGYLGVATANVNLAEVFYKLALRVVLPVVVGQVLQKTSTVVVQFVARYKPRFKAAQQYCLVFIVYTVFCRTFQDDTTSSVADVFLMIAFQFLSLTSLMVVAWCLLKLLFPNQPRNRVMGLFGCTHKTVAMGVPLINAIYEDNPAAIGLYTLPLLVWHPMQLVIGTFLAPRLAAFVAAEEARLGITGSASEEDETNDKNENKNDNHDNSNSNSNNNGTPEEEEEEEARALERTEEGRISSS